MRIELEPRADRVAVIVADTGPGIDPALRAGLFQRALKVGDARRGGLGLLIVQRMLQLQRSDISLQDRAGMGAVFEFLLESAR